MSIPGLTEMNHLLAAAATEVERWKQSPAAAASPPHRINAVLEKLRALHGCGSIGNLRAGLTLILELLRSLGAPTSEIATSLLQLAKLLKERNQR